MGAWRGPKDPKRPNSNWLLLLDVLIINILRSYLDPYYSSLPVKFEGNSLNNLYEEPIPVKFAFYEAHCFNHFENLARIFPVKILISNLVHL